MSDARASLRRQFTVTRHRPWRRRLAGLLALGLLVAAGWALFERGKIQAGRDLEAWQSVEAGLREQIASLEDRNAQMLRDNALLQRSADIDRSAYADIQRTLAELQTELLGVREELSFYRNLVTPGDKAAGLHVQNMQFLPQTPAGNYLYRLTLVQIRRNDRFAVGTVDFKLAGRQSGKPRTYAFSEVANGTDAIDFKFKYFQNFEGALVLPQEFEPESVTIDVIPRGKHLKAVSESFSWESLLSGGS